MRRLVALNRASNKLLQYRESRISELRQVLQSQEVKDYYAEVIDSRFRMEAAVVKQINFHFEEWLRAKNVQPGNTFVIKSPETVNR